MSKLAPLDAPELVNREPKRLAFTHDKLLILIAALYELEENLEAGCLGERADNVFMIDGYGYPSADEIEELRERINGM